MATAKVTKTVDAKRAPKPQKSLLSTEEVAQKADLEGLGYCVQNMFVGEDMENSLLQEMWATARGLLEGIGEILADLDFSDD